MKELGWNSALVIHISLFPHNTKQICIKANYLFEVKQWLSEYRPPPSVSLENLLQTQIFRPDPRQSKSGTLKGVQ